MNAIIVNIKNYLKAHATDIFMGLGITGVVGGTVLACVATTKVNPLMDEYRIRLQAILDAVYQDEKERKKEIRKLRTWLGMELTKLYGVPVVVEGLSIASILASYGGVKKTCSELAVTCLGLERTISGYRMRVREEVGEEKEEQIWLGGKEEVVEPEKKDEKGEIVEPEQKAIVYDDDLPSPYARWFCMEDSKAAELNEDYNRTFLEGMQASFRRILHNDRFLLLNTVYTKLGFKPTVAGNHVGWVLDSNDPNRDNEIDLRIRIGFRRTESGAIKRTFMIDPNVDGNIEALCVKKKLMLE